MPNLNNIAEQSIKALEKKTFGGVSRESAEKGIKNIKEGAEKIINELQQDINGKSQVLTQQTGQIKDLNQKLANANAANQYQATQLAEQAEKLKTTEESLSKTNTQLNKAKQANKTKTAIQKHDDGSQTIRKSNKNGARMTIEKDAQGRTKSIEVEQLDGSKRMTKYRSESEIREYTKTNYNDRIVEYDLAGNTKAITGGEVPTVVSRTESVARGGRSVIEEKLSNGKTIQTFKPFTAQDVGGFQILDKDGKIIEQFAKLSENGVEISALRTFGKDTATLKKVTKGNGRFEEAIFVTKKDANGNEYLAESLLKNNITGETVSKVTKTNSFGLPEKEIVTVKYGKDNPSNYGITESKIEYRLIDKGDRFMPDFRFERKAENAILSTSEGKTATLIKDYNGNTKIIDNQITPYNRDLNEDSTVRYLWQHNNISPVPSTTPRNYILEHIYT